MQRIVFSIDYGIRNLIKILKIRDGHRTLKLPEDAAKDGETDDQTVGHDDLRN